MFNKIPQKEMLEFNRVLGLLLSAKLSFISSLELMAPKIENIQLKKIVSEINKEIKNGQPISKCFAKYKDLFPDSYIANLKIGEETGDIGTLLNEYNIFNEKITNLKKKILQAIRYPLMVLITALGAIIFMIFFLIPSFENIFHNTNDNLPFITKWIILFSSFIIKYYLYIIATIIAGVAAIKYSWASNKEFYYKLLLKLPLVTKLYRTNILARFTQSMATLLKNRLPLIDSLSISKNITSNPLFRKEIEVIIKRINKGETFSKSIKSEFLDFTFYKLLSVGEASAELDNSFALLSDYYTKEFDYRIESVNSLIEPILIIFVGSIVGVILISLYMPMFDIINNVGF